MELVDNSKEVKKVQDDFLLYVVSLTGDVYNVKKDNLPKMLDSSIKELKETYIKYLGENEGGQANESIKISICYHGNLFGTDEDDKTLKELKIKNRDVIHWIPE